MTARRERVHMPLRRFAFGLALVGGLLVATPGWAQTTRVNETQPFAATVENPCVPEFVPFNGFIRLNETTRVRSDGSVQFIASDDISATGTGETTQVQYSYNDRLKINIIFDPDGGPILIRTRAKLISQGSTGNFYVTSVFQVSGDGQKSTSSFETDCRG